MFFVYITRVLLFLPFLRFTSIFRNRYIFLLRIEWKCPNRIKFPKINIRTTHAPTPLRCMSVCTLHWHLFQCSLCISLFICANCYREGKNLTSNTIGKSQKLYCRKLGSRASDIAVRTRGYFHIETFCKLGLTCINNYNLFFINVILPSCIRNIL